MRNNHRGVVVRRLPLGLGGANHESGGRRDDAPPVWLYAAFLGASAATSATSA
ncbi:MAG: hypothetical protein UZ03_NOB001000308 [Nitrospira sp. OLB3]|nr:MAG: hypothetical protein UZ03_NOB001000308 [Nitrospira sp. OLB3]